MGRGTLQILLVLYVLCIVRVVSNEQDGGDDNDDGDDDGAAGRGTGEVPQGQQANDVQEGLHDLEKGKTIAEQATGKSGEETKSRIDKLKEAAKAEYKNFNENRMRQKEYGQSFKDAGNGMAKFSRGIKNGDWKESLSGAMDFIGGFIFLATPWGPIASGLLSVASSMLGLFFNKPPSTAEILKNIVQEANDNTFTDNVKGVIEKFKTLRGTLGDMKKQLEDSDYSAEVKESIGKQAAGFQVEYLTPGTELKAGFDRRKGDYCSTSDKLPKCGKFLMLYIDLTNMRQLGLALLAAVLQDVDNYATAKNLESTIKRAQRSDCEFLRFLADPYHSTPGQRKVVAILWENPWFYENLFKYLVKLQKIHSNEQGKNGIFRDDVLLCKERYLMGECNTYPATERKVKLGAWRYTFKSAMIPAGQRLKIYRSYQYHSELKGDFIGPDVKSYLPFPERANAIFVKSVDLNEQNALKQARLCTKVRDRSGLVDFNCDYFDYGEYPRLVRMDVMVSYNNELDGIMIPEKMKVTAYTEKNFGGTQIGPIIGPYYSMSICKKDHWSSLKIEKTDEVASSMIEISNLPPQLTPGQTVAPRLQIDICGGKGKGEEVTKQLSPIKAQGCDIDLKYMRIPGKCKVVGYSSEQYAGKHYRGWMRPVGWKPVESSWRSMKITATCDGTESDNP